MYDAADGTLCNHFFKESTRGSERGKSARRGEREKGPLRGALAKPLSLISDGESLITRRQS
jgi:hypothetical protein